MKCLFGNYKLFFIHFMNYKPQLTQKTLLENFELNEDYTVPRLTFLWFFSAFPEYESCKIVVIPAKYDMKPFAYGFQKDSPYLGVFNYYLKEMREKGSLKQIQKKYDPPDQVSNYSVTCIMHRLITHISKCPSFI